MKKTLTAAVVAAAIAIPSIAMSQSFKNSSDAVEYRQSAFIILATHFGMIGGEIKKGASADTAAILRSANVVNVAASLPWAGFGPNTQGGSAQPAIWQNEAKFKQLSGQLQSGTATLLKAAQEKNVDKIGAAFADLQNTCKACHTDFKKR